MEYLIIFLPFIGAIVSGFFGKIIGDKFSEVFTTILVTISTIFSFIIFYEVLMNGYLNNIKIFSWINSGDLKVNWSIKIDALSATMLVVVGIVSSLVHVYSIGYMHNDNGRSRFMSYLSLFTFAMLTLVTSDNFLQLFFGWGGVGLCSYFLIGFWYKKPTANAAAIKAFVVNRVGDFGFALGIFLIFYYFKTLNYTEIFNQASSLSVMTINFLGAEVNLITSICLLLFLGSMGKSAQIFFILGYQMLWRDQPQFQP